MKLGVVEPHSVVRRTLGLVQDEFVVQAELALWCAREIGPHEDLAIDIGAEDVPVARLAPLWITLISAREGERTWVNSGLNSGCVLRIRTRRRECVASLLMIWVLVR